MAKQLLLVTRQNDVFPIPFDEEEAAETGADIAEALRDTLGMDTLSFSLDNGDVVAVRTDNIAYLKLTDI